MRQAAPCVPLDHPRPPPSAPLSRRARRVSPAGPSRAPPHCTASASASCARDTTSWLSRPGAFQAVPMPFRPCHSPEPSPLPPVLLLARSPLAWRGAAPAAAARVLLVAQISPLCLRVFLGRLVHLARRGAHLGLGLGLGLGLWVGLWRLLGGLSARRSTLQSAGSEIESVSDYAV